MATFTAYFDASGDPNHKFVIVSGYIANSVQWKNFDYSWRSAHADAGVNLPFHAADFMAALSNEKYKDQRNARQDYVELAKDTLRAANLLRRLCVIQISTVNCGISAIVPMDVYNGISSLLELREVVPPYALGARMCIERLRQWEQQFAIKDPVEIIFEEGDFEQGKFTQLMIDEGQSVPIYKGKADFTGLQAADHYTWEQNYLLKQHAKDVGTTPRDSMVALIHSIPKLHTSPTTATLISLCHAKGINPKTGIRG